MAGDEKPRLTTKAPPGEAPWNPSGIMVCDQSSRDLWQHPLGMSPLQQARRLMPGGDGSGPRWLCGWQVWVQKRTLRQPPGPWP